jgi:hypothetical protein
LLRAATVAAGAAVGEIAPDLARETVVSGTPVEAVVAAVAVQAVASAVAGEDVACLEPCRPRYR